MKTQTKNELISSAIILAGGKSSRMGTDKGLVVFRNKPLVCHMIDLVKPYFTETIIISNNDEYKKFGLPVYNDAIDGHGPLVGMLTGLLQSSSEWNFITACDLPLLNMDIIAFIQKECNDIDAVIPYHHGNPEPLCAFYNKSCIKMMKNNLDMNKFKIQDLFPELKIAKVNIPSHFFERGDPFKNFNFKEDIQNYNE